MGNDLISFETAANLQVITNAVICLGLLLIVGKLYAK